jgi:hypothetical protein
MKQLRHAAAAAAALWAGRTTLIHRRKRRSRPEPLEIGGDGAYVEPATPRD